MIYLHFLVAIATLVSIASADYSEAFCKKYMGEWDDTNNVGLHPSFYDNFYVYVEQKYMQEQTVIDIEEWYSQEGGVVYSSLRSKVNSSTIWIYADSDEAEIGPTAGQMCTDEPLDGSDVAKSMGLHTDANGKIQMNTPEDALGWNKKFQKGLKNVGDSMSRGIKTIKWQVCAYRDDLDATFVMDWDIVDPATLRLPVVRKNEPTPIVLPVSVLARAESTSGGNAEEVAFRTDYTSFDRIMKDDPHFQVPVNMLCRNKPSASKDNMPLPQVPDYFRFRGEQVTILDYNTQTPSAPSMVYTVEYYEQKLQIFIQDIVQAADSPNSVSDKSFIRRVSDYNTGISYMLDLVSGSCQTSAIEADSIDSIKIAGGLVKMRNSAQFFDEDYDQYQYVGVHTIRGIECNAWSAFFAENMADHPQNSMFTWYFATQNWMMGHGFADFQAMPIALEVSTETDYHLFNIFEFDTKDTIGTPDLTLCYDPSATLNIEVVLSGAYHKVVSPDFQEFGRMFVVSLMSFSRITSFLRVGALDIQPGENNEIICRAKIFDDSSLNIQSNVQTPQERVPNSQIYKQLQDSISSGKFTVEGSIPVKGKRIGLQQATGFSASYGGGGSSGFSGGSMAGIGIGMLIVGLATGILAVFLFKRFRGGVATDNVALRKMEESTS